MRKKIIITAVFLLAATAFGVALAADKPTTLIVPLNGVTSVTQPGEYINLIYRWGLGLAALVALARLIMGGVMKTLSAGNVVEEGAANQVIKDGVYGLILLIAISLILTTINPKLTNISLPSPGNLNFASSTPAVPAKKVIPDGTPDVQKPYVVLYASVDDYVNKKSVGTPVDIHFFTGYIGKEHPGTADLYEFMTAATEAEQKNDISSRDLYRDAVLKAVQYAKATMNPDDFAQVADIMNHQVPANLYASEYLKDTPNFPAYTAPTGGTSTAQEKQLILDAAAQLGATDRAVFDQIKAYIDDDASFNAADTIEVNATSGAAQLGINYGKVVFDANRYDLFSGKLKIDGIFELNPNLTLPPL